LRCETRKSFDDTLHCVTPATPKNPVIPAKAGIQAGRIASLPLKWQAALLDSRLHGNDGGRVVSISRRSAGKLIAGSLAGLATHVHAKDSALPVPTSLPQAALAAKASGEPLVLLISLPGCVYCERVRRSYLLPARQNDGLQAWQLDVTDKVTALIGFDNQPTTAALQAKVWKATFTPTVLFISSQGQELAERLVGIAVPDFYGAYLEQRLATARKAV
jgi:hypothetical protein